MELKYSSILYADLRNHVLFLGVFGNINMGWSHVQIPKNLKTGCDQ